MAHRDRPMPEMDDLDGVRMAGHGRRVVVIPAVRGRCRARRHQGGALLGGVLAHVPSRCRAALYLVQRFAPVDPSPRICQCRGRKRSAVDTTPRPPRDTSGNQPGATVERTSPCRPEGPCWSHGDRTLTVGVLTHTSPPDPRSRSPSCRRARSPPWSPVSRSPRGSDAGATSPAEPARRSPSGPARPQPNGEQPDYSLRTTSTEISTAGTSPRFSSQWRVFRSSGQPRPGPYSVVTPSRWSVIVPCST